LPYPKKGKWVPTLIKEGATIGANATILCGITIGAWALIGCGAVVTKDVTDYAIVKGNPAQFHAWICECGETLHFKKKYTTVCLKCKRNYKKEKNKIFII
jgi:UDP-2-acetamido-3-amino-2,3-dideoxy-glucuronate N-acetyltransferase